MSLNKIQRQMLDDNVVQELNNTAAQLAETANKLKNTVSILEYEHLKVAVTEGYDWQAAFTQAFAEYTRVTVPDGDFHTSSTIVIPKGQSLEMTTKTRIIALSDIDILEMYRESELVNGQLLLKEGATKSCLKFNGMNKVVDFSVTGTILRGVGYTGIGIHFDCSDPIGDINTSYVMMGAFHNVKIKSVNIGVWLNNGATKGWANGNTFNSLQIFGAKVFIRVGDHCHANTFNNSQLQWATVTEKFLNIEGSYNKFTNTVYWDAPAGLLMIEFGEISQLNRVDYSHANATEGRKTSQIVIDKGKQNFVVDPYVQEQIGLSANSTSYLKNDGSKDYSINRFFGDQDDILYNAGRKYTVTNSTGMLAVHSMFKSSDLIDALFSEYTFTGNEEVFTQVDFGASSPAITGFGISFYNNDIASDFKIISVNSSGVETELYKVTGNRNASIYIPLFQGVTTNKLKLVIQKALYITGVKTDNKVRVKRFYAKAQALGGTFVPTTGGKIDGQLQFLYSGNENQGVVLNSPNGTKFLLQVDNTGVLTTKQI